MIMISDDSVQKALPCYNNTWAYGLRWSFVYSVHCSIASHQL